MPVFGMSAFLRIVHLNPRPQRTELRKRLRPSGKPYDFHSSLRRLAQSLMVHGETLEGVLARASEITQEPERLSAQVGLRRLDEWRRDHPAELLDFDDVTYRSPGGRFGVKFTANYGMEIGGQSVAIHLWNTTRPRLEERLVRATLSLFVDGYRETRNPPDDLAVLCLRTLRLIRLGNPTDVRELGRLIVADVDSTFADLEREERPPRPGEQPPAPQLHD